MLGAGRSTSLQTTPDRWRPGFASFASVLRLMVDTCVWLDVAKDVHGEALIAATRVLVGQGDLELLVPRVVIDEYERNHDQVVASLAAGTRTHLKKARAALAEHGRSKRNNELLQELEDITQRGVLAEELAAARFGEVRTLLEAGRTLEPTAGDESRVIERALDKRAPFHRQRNSVADALLIEMYRSASRQAAVDADDHFGFVTHNTRDFSDPQGRAETPHPDLREYFEGPRFGYYTSLGAAYALRLPGVGDDLLGELAFEPEDPRSGREILTAERRLFDLIWYHRSLDGMDAAGRSGRARIEATYSSDELGPYSDFEWGMLNGKLSALRWVLGAEWDFLDT